MGNNLDVTCPCCDTKLRVDKKTGEVVWKEEKKKEHASLADMVKGLDEQRKENQSMFQKQSELQKDKARLLKEKFKEAQKNVDKTDTKPLRDFDLD
ncbi:MAG: 2-nitropropane dioxygenase [Nitrospinaceae bacterium]|nr:2-nitropropane dioxygenase [Nitrospinaceae bacterium]NIR56983.1 2-nitropropane dioxygenase [Nitrospinaceae bacterium]NIS87440.1 2-nitropropane dioxygenase [Nitrospinaceae bacterium]NIT84289.1 2-nitropropane dioxygenase [Nitrospinaceae bacterium]NIU46479.1 2-nitropropane dioxygenase [Nitrospinaceae bacterium]